GEASRGADLVLDLASNVPQEELEQHLQLARDPVADAVRDPEADGKGDQDGDAARDQAVDFEAAVPGAADADRRVLADRLLEEDHWLSTRQAALKASASWAAARPTITSQSTSRPSSRPSPSPRTVSRRSRAKASAPKPEPG